MLMMTMRYHCTGQIVCIGCDSTPTPSLGSLEIDHDAVDADSADVDGDDDDGGDRCNDDVVQVPIQPLCLLARERERV